MSKVETLEETRDEKTQVEKIVEVEEDIKVDSLGEVVRTGEKRGVAKKQRLKLDTWG